MGKKPDIRDYDWEDLPGVDYEHLHYIPEGAKNTEQQVQADSSTPNSLT